MNEKEYLCSVCGERGHNENTHDYRSQEKERHWCSDTCGCTPQEKEPWEKQARQLIWSHLDDTEGMTASAVINFEKKQRELIQSLLDTQREKEAYLWFNTWYAYYIQTNNRSTSFGKWAIERLQELGAEEPEDTVIEKIKNK